MIILNFFSAPTKKHTHKGCVSLAFEDFADLSAKRRRSVEFTEETFSRTPSLPRTNLRTPQTLPQFLLCAYEKTHPQGVCFVGAEKRIRTSGRFQAYTRFPIVLLKPLRHLCIIDAFHKAPIYITVFF